MFRHLGVSIRLVFKNVLKEVHMLHCGSEISLLTSINSILSLIHVHLIFDENKVIVKLLKSFKISTLTIALF